MAATRQARGSRRAALPLVSALGWLVVIAAPAVARSQASGSHPGDLPPPTVLAALWEMEHVSPALPPLLTHPEVERRLREVARTSPDLFRLEETGRSVEGRSINHLWFGRGPTRVLLWSQMHGDEPTATAALFDLVEHVRRHRDETYVRRLLASLTIHLVPMLNPDGAERFQRRNAQGIDVNRDALRLQTPEGRALKALRDRLQPSLGFNLHNQTWRTSAGRTGRPASISLLSVAFDEARSESPGRVLTKKVCAVIRDALEPLAPGQIARYDDEFEVRAFGDNITKWGTSVVLIETGATAGPQPDRDGVRLNFVGILTALDRLASGQVEQADPARYDLLPMNESNVLHTVIRNATVVPGTGVAPFVADVGIVANRAVRDVDGTRTLRTTLRIDDLGDLRVLGGLEDVDATGLTVAPLFDPGLEPGTEVRIPESVTSPPPAAPEPAAGGRPPAEGRPTRRPTVAVGEPADLVLLRPTDRAGVYRVERVFVSGG